MRAAAFWTFAIFCGIAAVLLFMSAIMLWIEDKRRQDAKPRSEWRQPPAGPGPGGKR